MAHEVENMFSVKEVPWHQLGKIVQDAPSIAEGIVQAGLNWTVRMEPTFMADGRKLQGQVVVRETDNSILGEVGSKYHPLQNAKAFEFFEPFIQSGEVSLETAGSLDNGRKIWVLAQLNRDPMTIVKGDEVRKYILLTNRHDGMASAQVGFTPIRVVCANTLAAAIGATDSALLRVRHTKKIELALENIQEMVNTANQQFEASGERFKAMVRMGVKEADLKKYVHLVFYPNVTEQEITERQQTRLHAITEDIRRLFETGFGADIKGVGGTMWGLYNGVTQYLSYEAKDNADKRFDSLWFGQSKDINARAMSVATTMAAGGAQ
jgi:phage/plasmid-like protein (TIGR03299 family)